jgi:leader peptidase (prepilin peptidase)/N-methyltransferase
VSPSGLVLLVAAPFVGSFLGVVAARLPEGRDFVGGRSRCDSCGTVLGWRELVPVVSWLAQRGRCRHCGAPIGAEPLLFELAGLGVAVWAVAMTDGWLVWATAGLGWVLLVLAAIDLRHLILPDVLTLPLIPAGLAVIWLIEPERLLAHAVGALLGWACLALLATAYRRLRGIDGLGMGDAKLLAAAGAWVGAEGLPSVLMAAAVPALAVALLQGWRRGRLDRQAALAFGPWLCLGFWLVWLYGPVTP